MRWVRSDWHFSPLAIRAATKQRGDITTYNHIIIICCLGIFTHVRRRTISLATIALHHHHVQKIVWKHYISVVIMVCMIWYVSLLCIWRRHTLNNLFHLMPNGNKIPKFWVRLKFWLLIRKYILRSTCFYQ